MIALLHATLYRPKTPGRVGLASYLRQITLRLFRSLVVDPGTVRLNLDLGPGEVDADRAVSCGLIVNALVTNSLKHGLPDGRTGEVTIRLRESDDGAADLLSVSDHGVGLPMDFDSKRQGSLGLQLVSDLARQLEGSLNIEPGPVAAFGVTFNPTRTMVTLEIPPLDGKATGI